MTSVIDILWTDATVDAVDSISVSNEGDRRPHGLTAINWPIFQSVTLSHIVTVVHPGGIIGANGSGLFKVVSSKESFVLLPTVTQQEFIDKT